MVTPNRSAIGRDALVRRALVLAGDPAVRLILLAGEAGTGKSFLLDRIARELGAARAWGVPAVSDVPLSALAHLVAPARTRIELIRGLLDAVGPVVCVDDLDGCDPLSQSLLERLASEPGRTVIATVRSERGAPPVSIEPLVGRAGTRVVPVPPLSRRESDALVRDELGAPVSARLLDEVWDRASGNPLFTVQMVRSAADEGILQMRTGQWSTVGRLPVPGSLRQTLTTRLASLPADAREAAEFLAGLGRVPLARFTERRASALQALLSSGLVAIEDRGDGRGESAGFTHPLFAEAVWERTNLVRRRRVLAEHLAAERAEPAPDAARIAVLALDLDGRASPSELMPALRLAAGGLDASVVLRFTTAAIATTSGHDLEEAVRAEAGALVQLGRVDEAFAVLLAALDRVRPGRSAVRLALLLNELMVWAGGDQPGAGRMLRAQRRRYPRWLRLPRAAFAIAEADGLVYAGRHIEALDLLERRARPWRRMDRELAVARATVRAHALAQAGAIVEAEASLREADAASSTDVEVAPVLRSLVTTLWGSPVEGEGIAAEAYRVASDAGFVHGQAFAALAAAVGAEHRGDPASTLEWADRSATAAQSARMPDVLRLALLRTAVAQAVGGGGVDPTTISQLDDVAGGVGFFRHQVPLAHAWAALGDGDPETADQVMSSAVDEARRDGAIGSLGLLLHQWMRMGRSGLAEQVAALPTGSPLADARLVLARGLDSRDPGLLLDAADRFERHGMPLAAAEAVAAAARTGAANRERLRARARTLAATVGSPRTPLLGELPESAPLTRREREVAALARRRSSPEIAETLHLSVRTVENHLARAFKKLGISARADLPDDLDG